MRSSSQKMCRASHPYEDMVASFFEGVKMVYFVSVKVDHFSESGLLFSVVAQG